MLKVGKNSKSQLPISSFKKVLIGQVFENEKWLPNENCWLTILESCLSNKDAFWQVSTV